MNTFNKTLHPQDYTELGQWVFAYDYAIESRSIPYMPNPHLHRRWEYGMAMEFLRELGGPEKVPSVLDVGGAGSLFAPIALSYGYSVDVVDPDPCVHMLAGQERNCVGEGAGKARAFCTDFMKWNKEEAYDGTYDVVVSLSTIEHIENDVAFVAKLTKHARAGVFLTTDFSMGGERYSEGHMRTYTPKTLKNKIAAAFSDEWEFAGKPDWKENGPWVMGYNFASLGMLRKSVSTG